MSFGGFALKDGRSLYIMCSCRYTYTVISWHFWPDGNDVEMVAMTMYPPLTRPYLTEIKASSKQSLKGRLVRSAHGVQFPLCAVGPKCGSSFSQHFNTSPPRNLAMATRPHYVIMSLFSGEKSPHFEYDDDGGGCCRNGNGGWLDGMAALSLPYSKRKSISLFVCKWKRTSNRRLYMSYTLRWILYELVYNSGAPTNGKIPNAGW